MCGLLNSVFSYTAQDRIGSDAGPWYACGLAEIKEGVVSSNIVRMEKPPLRINGQAVINSYIMLP